MRTAVSAVSFCFVLLFLIPTAASGTKTTRSTSAATTRTGLGLPDTSSGIIDARTVRTEEAQYPFLVSTGTHSLTVPWHTGPVNDRWNPAFIIGTERTLKRPGHVRLYGTANIGYFRNYWWMTGVFLNSELGVGRRLPFGFHVDLRLGIGYLHYFWRRKVMELEDGRYVSAKDWGKPSLMIPLTLVLGYGGNPERPLTVAPFAAVQWAVQTPFIEESAAMTHFFLMLGARINWRESKPVSGR